MSAIHMDAKARLVDLLSRDDENSRLSLNNFRKPGSIEAVFIFYRAMNMYIQFARDPNATGKLEKEPEQPILTPDMSEEEIIELNNEYRKRLEIYEFAEQARALMVPFTDYVLIKEWATPYHRAINALPGLKGKRWHSLTKQIGDEQRRGLMAAIGGADKE